MSRLRGAALLEDQEVGYIPATLGWGLPGDHSSKSSKGAPGRWPSEMSPASANLRQTGVTHV